MVFWSQTRSPCILRFEKSGMEFLLTQSFAKNFGLYGERIGPAAQVV